MQIVETLNEQLKRSYTVTITAAEIDSRVDGEVERLAPQIKMPGFRPGKVPTNLVRKMHGEAIRQDALNAAIREGVDQTIREQKLRPATQPAIRLGDGYEAGRDAELIIDVEVLPEIALPPLEGLKLEKLEVAIEDAEVDEAVARIAANQKSFEDAADGHKAEQGDQLVIDFEGSVDGVPFEGGKGEDMAVELGSGRLIPGFEDQLVGAKAGEDCTIEVTFPEDYGVASLAGRPATFAITVKAVKRPKETVLDDAFATSLGLESLEQLRGLVKGQIEQELAGLTRTQMKRQLLDQLAASSDFDVPPSMVEAEFGQIWQQLEQEAEQEADPAAARAEMEAEREDYRAIAVRRVRLGLLLSEIGQANGVEITQQEMNMLLAQASQQYRPEDRQRFAEYIRNEPMAAAQLRAPLYEDKVVDFLFDKADVTARTVSRAELEAAIEAEDGKVPEPAEAKAPAKKGKSAKAAASGGEGAAAKDAEGSSTAGQDAAQGEPAAGEAPAKKPRAKKATAGKDAAGTAEPDAAAADTPAPAAAKKPRAKKAAAKEAEAKEA